MSAPSFSDIIVGVDEEHEHERTFPPHTMWREARVSGQNIPVHFPIAEVAQYHQSDLVEDVKSTNLKDREHLEKHRAHEARKQKAKEVERVVVLRELWESR